MAKNLNGTAHNEIFYLNNDGGLIASHEIVLILREPHHSRKMNQNGEDEHIKTDVFENVRFEITKENAEGLSVLFAQIAQRMSDLENQFNQNLESEKSKK